MSKIAFAGCKTTTYECMKALVNEGFSINRLITLSPEQGMKYDVSGYMDLSDFARANGINIYYPETYALKNEVDKKTLISAEIDCLIVIGWQRLIPEWFLKHLNVGAFGMHGSPEPLPRGRGRSPMNWALLNGKSSFLTHLFKYDSGIDSGEIVDVQKFEINVWDDCESLHFKNRLAMNRLLMKHLPSILSGKIKYIKQPADIEPTFYPKRSPDDGRIVWSEMDMTGLYNHVRCQTRPFPGAFSYWPNTSDKFYFWKVFPFDGFMTFPEARPGNVVELFHDGTFLVTVWDGSVRVIDYTSPTGLPPEVGIQFQQEPL